MIAAHSEQNSILILAPTGNDAPLAHSLLREAGIRSVICSGEPDLSRRAREGTYGAILIAEEALTQDGIRELNQILSNQEPWSDLPIVLLTSAGHQTEINLRIWNTFAVAGNVTLLERPVRTSTLLSAIQVALRARRRQYQVRQLLLEKTEATRIRDEFISIASHELKTPLTAMRLQTQIAKRMFLAAQPEPLMLERAKKTVFAVDDQAAKLTRLVDDMLDVSRIQAGRFEMALDEVELCGLARRLAEQFSPQLSAAGITLSFEAPESIVGAWDPLRLEQVLANLFSNAVRYAPGSPLEMKIRTDGDQVVLQFSDHGPGIAKDSLERIFHRFERLTGDKKIRGMGLGLYICRKIVEAHGGTIRADSRLGEGTTFAIELPLRRNPAQLGRVAPEVGEVRLGS